MILGFNFLDTQCFSHISNAREIRKLSQDSHELFANFFDGILFRYDLFRLRIFLKPLEISTRSLQIEVNRFCLLTQAQKPRADRGIVKTAPKVVNQAINHFDKRQRPPVEQRERFLGKLIVLENTTGESCSDSSGVIESVARPLDAQQPICSIERSCGQRAFKMHWNDSLPR